MTTPQGLIKNSVWTSLSGVSSSIHEMASVFLLSPRCLVFLFPRTQPELWVMVHSSTTSGLWGSCLPLNNACQLFAWSSSQWSSQPHYRAIDKPQIGAIDVWAIQPLSASCVRAPLGFLTWWFFFATCPSCQPVVPLCAARLGYQNLPAMGEVSI